MATIPDFSGIITSRARSLIEAGVVQVSIHLSRDGVEIWSRVTQPHPRLGIKTNQSFPVEDLVDMLEKVSIPERKKGATSDRVDSIVRDSQSSMSFQEALSLNKGGKLGKYKTAAGPEIHLSLGSLTYPDLEKSGRELEARAVLVSHKIGLAKLTARAAQPNLYIEGCDTLLQWWRASLPEQKWALLTDAKHVLTGCKTGSADTLIEAKIGGLRYPFRATEDSEAGEDSEDSGETA